MAFFVTLFVCVVPVALLMGYLVIFDEKELGFANYTLLAALFGGVYLILLIAYLFQGRK